MFGVPLRWGRFFKPVESIPAGSQSAGPGYPSITAAIFALDRIDFATGLRLAPLAGTSAAEETLAGAKDVEGSGKTAAFVCRLSRSSKAGRPVGSSWC